MPASAARGSPIDDPHIGGIGFTGPTTGDLTSIYWNPAAVGLQGGHHLVAGATSRFVRQGVERTAIDPTTGLPGGTRTFPRASGRGDLHPVDWPLGPGGFLAVAASLGDRFTLGIATYTPFAQRVRWDALAGGEEPTRYHAVSTDIENMALVPALSIRVGGGLRIGAAPGFLFSVGRIVVDEDTGADGSACGAGPCGIENPAAAARYDVSSGLGLFDSSLAFTLGVGLHFERGRWALGAAYLTRPLGTEDGTEINGRHTRVTPPPRAGAAQLCPAEVTGSCASGHAVYRLPDTIILGGDVRLDPRFTLGVTFRWLDLSQHDAIRLRIVGPANGSLRALNLERELILHRGLRDVLDSRVRLLARLGTGLELHGGFRVETPSNRRASVSPGFIDGWKLEPSAAVRVRLASWLQLAGGYAFTFMPAVTVDDSVFDPTAVAGCTAAGEDLNAPACGKRAAGQARPGAAGRYEGIAHTFSLTLNARL